MDATLAEQIHSEIVDNGLANELDRLKDAYDNRRFYETCFEEYTTRPENSTHERLDFRRTSPIMQRVVDELTAHLYATSPKREIAGQPDATEWLERVYMRNAMLPKWQEADRLTHVTDLAAFQFAGDEDPNVPVKVHLWGGDQLVWWLDPDDQTMVAAVGTIDKYDARRRLTVWTDETISVYMTDKQTANTPGPVSAYKLVGEPQDNPYTTPDGRGIIPFTFVHHKYPATDFHQRGPGSSLRQLNDYVNYDLDDIGDGKRYLSKPINYATGVDAGFTIPALIRPGMWLRLEPSMVDANAAGVVPQLGQLTNSTTWVSSNWEDLQSYIDHELLMHGVPPGTFRLSASATSGVQVLAEQLPLLKIAEKRRTPFQFYERDAARKCMLVAAAHLRIHGTPDAALEAAASDPDLMLRWPNLYTLMPGTERNIDDQWRVDSGFASKVQILVERENLSRDQALERLKQIKKDNDELMALGIEPRITPLPPATSPTSEEAKPANA